MAHSVLKTFFLYTVVFFELLSLPDICRGSSTNKNDCAKSPLHGLISMGQNGYGADNENAKFDGIPGSSLQDLEEKRNAFDGVVINVPWSLIEPNQNRRLNLDYVENVLEKIRIYNRDPRTIVTLRSILRVWAAANAPDWAKSLEGDPLVFHTENKLRRQQYTLGRPWSHGYIAAWKSLQSRLASVYDEEPLIAQVSNTSCTTNDDEWNSLARYQNKAEDVSSLRTLRQAGFSDKSFEDCVSQSLNDYTAWKCTQINSNVGPTFITEGVDNFSVPQRNSSFPISLLSLWRKQLGSRAVFSNHNLSYPVDARVATIYEAIKLQGGEIEFQTHSPHGLDWPHTIQEAVCLGGRAVELWNSTDQGGYTDISTETLQHWSQILKVGSVSQVCQAK